MPSPTLQPTPSPTPQQTTSPTQSATVTVTSSPEPSATASAWRAGPPLPRPRAEFGATVVGNRLYVVGGFDALHQGQWLTEVDVYDATTDTWTQASPLEEGRDHPAVAGFDGRVYLFGGGSPGLRDDAFVYEPGSDEWRPIANMPARRAQAAAVAIRDRIYLFGGVTPSGPGGAALETWAYDPAADAWTANLAPIPTQRNHLMAVQLDGRAWVIGGRWDLNVHAVESYDPATDTWQTERPLPVATSGATAAVRDGLIHVTGGEDLATFGTINAHQTYDFFGSAWNLEQPLPIARHGLGSGFLGDLWYVVGGGPSADYSASDRVDIFTP